MTKKLYRSDTNQVISGVIGGIGEYYDIDPTILRIGYLLVAIVTHIFPAIIVYIIASVIMPKKPHITHTVNTES